MTDLDFVINEVSEADKKSNTVAKAAALAAGVKLVVDLFAKSPPKLFKDVYKSKVYSSMLTTAMDEDTKVAAVVGLLGVCSFVLLNTKEFKDLGYKVQQVVQSNRFEKYGDKLRKVS